MQKQESLEWYKDYCLSYSYSKMKIHIDCTQWRNSWGGGRGQSAPRHFSPGNFCWPTRKRERQGKMEKKKKRRKIKESGKFEMEGKKLQNEKRTFFFFFFCFFTFQNHWNLFWVYQSGNFLPGKSISLRERNREKRLCPLWKILLLRLWLYMHSFYSPIWRALLYLVLY